MLISWKGLGKQFQLALLSEAQIQPPLAVYNTLIEIIRVEIEYRIEIEI